MLVLWREENHRTRRITLEQDENPGREPGTRTRDENPGREPRRQPEMRTWDENQQQTQLACGTKLKLEPWPHWWEASVLTTAPSLLSSTSGQFVEYFLILSFLFLFQGWCSEKRPDSKHTTTSVRLDGKIKVC